MEENKLDVRDEYNVYRNMANYYAGGVYKLWNNDPKTVSAMKKIVEGQTSVANRLKTLHTSLEKDPKAPTSIEEKPALDLTEQANDTPMND